MPSTSKGTDRPGARRAPVQQRSAERLELILQSAKALIAENGAEALKMSDLAQRAGISIGSLYQYFPERSAVVAALALRFNEEGQACVKRILKDVSSPEELRVALCAVIDGYYAMFLDEPVMRDIWAGALADKSLQSIDEEDCRAHGTLIANAMRRAYPASRRTFEAEGRLSSVLISAAVRHAVSLDAKEGKVMITLFKKRFVEALTS